MQRPAGPGQSGAERSGADPHPVGARIGAVKGDTRDEAAEVLRLRTLQRSPSQRVEEGIRVSLFARQVMRAGIRARHPEYGPGEVEDALARLLWGDDLFRAARPGRRLLDP